MMSIKVILAFLTTVVVVFGAPAAPSPYVWADEFSVPIQQTIKVAGQTHTNRFMYYYDAINKVSRTDHGKGQFDEMCRSIRGKQYSDEACTFLVALDGWRYVLFPGEKSCCKYCNTSVGCGIIKKDWLKGATYQGQMRVDGQVCDGWMKKGGEENYFYATTGSVQKPCLYYEGYPTLERGVNMWNYSIAEYKEGPQDPSFFKVPSTCTKMCVHS